MSRYEMIDLTLHFCNFGFSFEDEMDAGDFTGVGSSYPAEQLPESHEITSVEGIPFQFPTKQKGEFNNLEFFQQIIDVPNHIYYCMHILGSADNGSFYETISLLSDNEQTDIQIGLSDWIIKEPEFGEMVAFRCQGMHTQTRGVIKTMKPTIWYQRIELPEGTVFNSMKFTDNPGMHIFAITLEKVMA